MSVEENIVLMRRWFKEVWNEGRVQTIYDLMAENAIAVGQDQPGKELRGPRDFVTLFNRIRGAFPDIKITIEDAFGADNSVVVRWSGVMTHTGDQQASSRHRHHHCADREWQDRSWLGQLGPVGPNAAAFHRRRGRFLKVF